MHAKYTVAQGARPHPRPQTLLPQPYAHAHTFLSLLSVGSSFKSVSDCSWSLSLSLM